MEQNRFDNLGVTEKKEPLPTFNEQPEKVTQYDTLPNMVFQEQPEFVFEKEIPNQDIINKIQKNAELSLGRGIAALIMSNLPILSIFAFFVGEDGVVYADKAFRLARKHNIRASGKLVVARILSLVSKYNAIPGTIIWLFFFTVWGLTLISEMLNWF